MKKIAFLLNPASGGGHGNKMKETIEALLQQRGIAYDLICSEYPGHLQKLAAQIGRNYRMVVACGGDGTIYEVANGLWELKGPRPTLGILAMGTGSDLIRTLNYPKGIDAQLNMIIEGHKSDVDVGQAEYVDLEGHPTKSIFLNFVDASMGPHVIRKVPKFRKWLGRHLAYAPATLTTYFDWLPKTLHVHTDDPNQQDWSVKPYVFVVCNGRYVGGGMKISPQSDLQDGCFEVTSMSAKNFATFLSKMIQVLGHHVPATQFQRAHFIEVNSPETVEIALDGQIVGRLPAKIRTIPQALSIITPHNHHHS